MTKKKPEKPELEKVEKQTWEQYRATHAPTLETERERMWMVKGKDIKLQRADFELVIGKDKKGKDIIFGFNGFHVLRWTPDDVRECIDGRVPKEVKQSEVVGCYKIKHDEGAPMLLYWINYEHPKATEMRDTIFATMISAAPEFGVQVRDVNEYLKRFKESVLSGEMDEITESVKP